MGWNRAVISDIDESLDCGVDAVAISISTSDIHIKHKLKKDREWVLQSMVKATQYAKKNPNCMYRLMQKMLQEVI